VLDFDKWQALISDEELAQMVNLEDLKVKLGKRWQSQELWYVPRLVTKLSLGREIYLRSSNNLTQLEFKSAAELDGLCT